MVFGDIRSSENGRRSKQDDDDDGVASFVCFHYCDSASAPNKRTKVENSEKINKQQNEEEIIFIAKTRVDVSACENNVP